MLSEGVQHGHKGIALLTPFSLVDHMGVAAVVGPEMLGGVGAKLDTKGSTVSLPRTCWSPVQHRSS